ncbi:MAG: transporter associated domain-containing protein [Pseudomonadota bacterium]
MSEDKPPSTQGSNTGFWQRLLSALRGEPKTREEILHLIDAASEQEVFDEDERSMLTGVLEVSETQVREVMIPRSQMVVLEDGVPFGELLQAIIESGHSRFPMHNGEREEIVGILLAKDLLNCMGHPLDKPLDVSNWLRPPVFIPESKRLNTLLKEFRASHNHMAIVVDEYGGVSGLLTIEDVLEEIVGEIDDEHDQEEDAWIRRDGERDGVERYAVRALTRIDDFNEHFSCDLPDEQFDTIGGLVMTELGRLPRRGEAIEYDGFRFVVTRADRRRIDMLSVFRVEKSEEHAA